MAAGTLGLESYPGFLFYLLGTIVVSLLIVAFPTKAKPDQFFYRPFADLWAGDVFSSLMSFVLTWTLFYGIVQA